MKNIYLAIIIVVGFVLIISIVIGWAMYPIGGDDHLKNFIEFNTNL